MESCHAAFNHLYDRIHLNCANDQPERIRRCLAHLSLQKVADCVDEENEENHVPPAITRAKRQRQASTA